MERNLQPSSCKLPCPMPARRARRFTGCWVFLPFACFALSLSAQTSLTNALPPLVPAYGEMRPTFWEQHGTAMLVGSLVLLALAGVVAWLSSRPQPPVMAPPEVLARERLAKLLGQPENGNVLSEISQTLRRYLLAALGFPSGEWTTSEFSAALAGNDKVGAELAQAVAGFLRECDARKFSPVNPSGQLNAAGRALELIGKVEQRRALWSAPVPGAASSRAPGGSSQTQLSETHGQAARATAPQTPGAANRMQTSTHPDAAASGDGRAP